jgi:hypothetical protein
LARDARPQVSSGGRVVAVSGAGGKGTSILDLNSGRALWPGSALRLAEVLRKAAPPLLSSLDLRQCRGARPLSCSSVAHFFLLPLCLFPPCCWIFFLTLAWHTVSPSCASFSLPIFLLGFSAASFALAVPLFSLSLSHGIFSCSSCAIFLLCPFSHSRLAFSMF